MISSNQRLALASRSKGITRGVSVLVVIAVFVAALVDYAASSLTERAQTTTLTNIATQSETQTVTSISTVTNSVTQTSTYISKITQTSTVTSTIIQPTTVTHSTNPTTTATPSPFIFQVAVLYSGSWNGWIENYSSTHPITNTTWSGTGNKTVSFQYYVQGYVCAFAQKLDGSGANLTLIVSVTISNTGGQETNSTVLPYGGVKVCNSAAV